MASTLGAASAASRALRGRIWQTTVTGVPAAVADAGALVSLPAGPAERGESTGGVGTCLRLGGCSRASSVAAADA